jgi:hypothetical protein
MRLGGCGWQEEFWLSARSSRPYRGGTSSDLVGVSWTPFEPHRFRNDASRIAETYSSVLDKRGNARIGDLLRVPQILTVICPEILAALS